MIIIFDPKTKKFPYPTDTASHYITIKKDNKAVFDTDYPYVDTSFQCASARRWYGYCFI